ncbi:MAG: hypothetical protein EPO38_14790 [Rhizorhabdus sp.]|jgi:hypothetical protein|nr:MAG: hypothetical protein EPO38_14790 [Rhizorhabdus sp.]
MAFLPFGYSFHIDTAKSPAEAKAAIRARMKSWFEVKNGARGWIAGPIICLWLSAFGSHGPMLFGWISKSGTGCSIRGRAGSDLNGMIMAVFLLLLMIFLIFQMALNGEGSSPVLVVTLLLFPLIFWMAHKDRRHADPLVRFLHDAASKSPSTRLSKALAADISSAIKLNVGGEDIDGPVTADRVHDALLDVGEGDFVILHSAPEQYIQTMAEDGRFVIERRDGSHLRHFQALRVSASTATTNRLFSFDEILSVLVAYASKKPMPDFLKWQPLAMPPN